MTDKTCKNCCRWHPASTVCVLWHMPHAEDASCQWFLERDSKEEKEQQKKEDDTWKDST